MSKCIECKKELSHWDFHRLHLCNECFSDIIMCQEKDLPVDWPDDEPPPLP